MKALGLGFRLFSFLSGLWSMHAPFWLSTLNWLDVKYERAIERDRERKRDRQRERDQDTGGKDASFSLSFFLSLSPSLDPSLTLSLPLSLPLSLSLSLSLPPSLFVFLSFFRSLSLLHLLRRRIESPWISRSFHRRAHPHWYQGPRFER